LRCPCVTPIANMTVGDYSSSRISNIGAMRRQVVGAGRQLGAVDRCILRTE
jgi:hypothetical protein